MMIFCDQKWNDHIYSKSIVMMAKWNVNTRSSCKFNGFFLLKQQKINKAKNNTEKNKKINYHVKLFKNVLELLNWVWKQTNQVYIGNGNNECFIERIMETERQNESWEGE